jgi:hypothetical protein
VGISDEWWGMIRFRVSGFAGHVNTRLFVLLARGWASEVGTELRH